MKTLDRYFLCFYLVVIVNLFMALAVPCHALTYELAGWYQGESGYRYALDTSKENKTPLILFFYLDSDKVCQKLDDVYFSAYAVYDFLNDIPKVAINLKGDEFETELAEKLEVKGDPTLLILFPFTKKDPVKTSPFLKERDMTPEEFASNIRNIFSLTYNEMGYTFFTQQKYEEAIKYYDLSIQYDSKRAYSFFALGSVYHAMAIEEKDMKYLKKAEEYYMKALKLDPENKECKEELKKLHKNKIILSK